MHRGSELPKNTPSIPAQGAEHQRRTWQRPAAAARATVNGHARQLLDELEKGLTRHGRDGFELVGAGDWTFEIRIARYPRLKGWWSAATDRAANHGRLPCLLYRLNDGPWHVVIALADIAPDLGGLNRSHRIEMDLAAFAALLVTRQATAG